MYSFSTSKVSIFPGNSIQRGLWKRKTMEFSHIFPLQSTCSSPSGIFGLHFLPLLTRHSYRELKIGQGPLLCQWLKVPLWVTDGSPQYSMGALKHSSIPLFTSCGFIFFLPAFFLTTLYYIDLLLSKETWMSLCSSLPAMLAPDEPVPAAQSFLFSTLHCCFSSKSPSGQAWKTCTRSSFLKKG